MNEFILAEQTHGFVRSQQWQTAVLPFGATEPHNLHMPYGTDIYESEQIGRRACGYAYQRGAKVLLLPTIPFGVNTNHLKVPGGMAISLTPTTLLKIITDVVESLERQGICKLLLLNSHGGNELKPLARELHHKTPVFIAVCNWFDMIKDVKMRIFSAPGEHADEMETGLGLELFPQFMKMDQAGPGTPKPTRFDAINKGWVSITRPWHLLTEDTGVGDPRQGTAEKGRRLLEIIEQRLGDFLIQFANEPLDAEFPF